MPRGARWHPGTVAAFWVLVPLRRRGTSAKLLSGYTHAHTCLALPCLAAEARPLPMARPRFVPKSGAGGSSPHGHSQGRRSRPDINAASF